MVSDDIVTTLRGECQCSDNCRDVGDPCISMRAADEIERLRAAADQAVKCLIADDQLLADSQQLVDLAFADRDRWKNWAEEYFYTDPDCECPLCDKVKAAINNG